MSSSTSSSASSVVTLRGQPVSFRVVPSSRATRVRIKVGLEGVRVVVPQGRRVDAAAVLRDKARWVLKHVGRVETLRDALPERRFADGASWPWLGEDRPLRVTPLPAPGGSASGRQTSHLSDDAFVLDADRVARHSVRDELERVYRAAARRHYADRAAHFGRAMGVTYESLHIRNQKTRWGSYSPRTGTLSMNFRLAMAPPAIVDYVIVHELAHVTEPNHSSRFWRIVERVDPDYRSKEAWLKANGLTLVFDAPS